MKDLHYQDGEDRTSPNFNPYPNPAVPADSPSPLSEGGVSSVSNVVGFDAYRSKGQYKWKVYTMFNPITNKYETQKRLDSTDDYSDGAAADPVAGLQTSEPFPLTWKVPDNLKPFEVITQIDPPKDQDWFNRELEKAKERRDELGNIEHKNPL